jgi:hypothetical protein
MFPYESLEEVKYQINYLDLDVLFLSTSLIDYKSLSFILQNLENHFVIKIIANNKSRIFNDVESKQIFKYSDILKAWKNEILISNAIQIIFESSADFNFSADSIYQKIRYIQSYDQLESIFYELLEFKSDKNRLLSKHSEIGFERDLHAKRMIKILGRFEKG